MEKLSPELLDHIVSYLDVKDAQSLACVPYKATFVAALSRLSPERYLRRVFRHPTSLLAAMTDHGCVISGSQALEFFVPGTVDAPDPSDWDFFVPCVPSSVIGMMAALAHNGVEWIHPLASFLEFVEKPPGAKAYVAASLVLHRIPDDLVLHMGETAGSDEAMALIGELEKQVKRLMYTERRQGTLDRPHWWIELEKTSSPSSPFRIQHLPDNYTPPSEMQLDPVRWAYYQGEGFVNTPPLFMINGSITVPGSGPGSSPRKVKVQLFQCHQELGVSRLPLEYILCSFYATHVQCFISGWAAGHFYHDLARQRLAIVWDVNGEHRLQHAPWDSVEKYRKRGYRFFNAADISEEFLDHRATFKHNNRNRQSTADSAVKPLQQHEWTPLLQQIAERPTLRCLGMPGSGTLLVPFSSLRRRIIQYAEASPPTQDGRGSYSMAEHYELLDKCIKQIFFHRVDEDCLKTTVPVLKELRWWGPRKKGNMRRGGGPSVSKILAWGVEKEAAESGDPSLSGTVAVCLPIQNTPEWAYYKRLLRLTKSCCNSNSCWHRDLRRLPPQI